MKKLSLLFTLFVLLTAFTCENEPLEGDFATGTDLSCEEALLNGIDAVLAFANATEADYTQLCNAYKVALLAQIEACGDPDGLLQIAVDDLGDCSNGDTTPDDCDAATTLTEEAEIAFNNANEDDYTDLCNAYKTALLNKINACGDDGSIQAIINDLGDCAAALDVEISVTAGTLLIEFDMVEVVVNGNILEVTGQTSAANNYMIYFEVEQGATGENIIDSTFVLSLISDFFPSTNPAPFDFLSSITTNDPGVLIGTFGNVVTNADGGDLSLSSGVINIMY